MYTVFDVCCAGWDGIAGRLNLVMELAPTNLDHAIRRLAAAGRTASTGHGKLYAYQMFRGLGYVHETAGLCHRDVKPSNLLLYPVTGVLKLCDFGSAKDLLDGVPNTRYACSRHYRAPELLFDQPPDAPDYTVAVDVWSAGCVYAELTAGAPLYPGTSVPHQRALVARPPSFPGWAPADVIRLMAATLRYDPSARPTASEACDHECFDALRRPGGHRLPPLFDDYDGDDADDYYDD
ncbi:uncharacterized protein LOC132953066 [Metopolophium dirhodum]|uniref:uncharacterized protein LOC132953066 n=1 Tax=Metopolophium dirhodum TaxID=44670 RepID=UPI00298F6206|nr:uncharacterized protein LOC132953066 [Metopolophium dirhodum]